MTNLVADHEPSHRASLRRLGHLHRPRQHGHSVHVRVSCQQQNKQKKTKPPDQNPDERDEKRQQRRGGGMLGGGGYTQRRASCPCPGRLPNTSTKQAKLTKKTKKTKREGGERKSVEGGCGGKGHSKTAITFVSGFPDKHKTSHGQTKNESMEEIYHGGGSHDRTKNESGINIPPRRAGGGVRGLSLTVVGVRAGLV